VPFLDFGEDEEEVELKFEDCVNCVFAGRSDPCRNCDIGEYFQEPDPEGIDVLFRV